MKTTERAKADGFGMKSATAIQNATFCLTSESASLIVAQRRKSENTPSRSADGPGKAQSQHAKYTSIAGSASRGNAPLNRESATRNHKTGRNIIMREVNTMQAKRYRLLRHIRAAIILGILMAVALLNDVKADTTWVSGVIDGEIWTPTGSPYCVVGDIRVGLLGIQPGVEVCFFGNFKFDVPGRLLAIGTQTDSILFQRAHSDSTRWQGIFFDRSANTSELSYCIIEGSQNSGVRIDSTDVTIRDCSVTRNTSSIAGGGIYAINNPQLSITRCKIYDNSNLNNQDRCNGGGLYADCNEVFLEDCEISGNTLTGYRNHFGGGVYVIGSLQMTNCLLRRNKASHATCDQSTSAAGGGLFVSGSAIISNSVVDSNAVVSTASWCGQRFDATGRGGGIYVTGLVEAKHCLIVHNILSVGSAAGTAVYQGGGLYSQGSANITNCTMAFNGYQEYYSGSAIATILNCILWDTSDGQVGGSTDVLYCCFPGAANVNGNIGQNPAFYGNNDFRLLSTSPCIDAGNPDPIFNDCEDPARPGMALSPSKGTVRNDMGVYGGPLNCQMVRPSIACPNEPISVTVVAPGEVCIPLQIANADSVEAGDASWVNDTLCFYAYSIGSYDFEVIAVNDSSHLADTCNFTVNVSGVIVEHEDVPPGGTVAVPIKLSTSQALGGFTIPLRYSTFQPNKIHLDSVVAARDTLIADSVIVVPDSSWFIVTRPMQPVPLPPDTGSGYTVGWAYFSIDADAQAEVIPIDTATIGYGGQTYSYQFVDTFGIAFVPLFERGSITVTTALAECGDMNGDGKPGIEDVVYFLNWMFTHGPAPVDVSGGDVDCDTDTTIADAVYYIRWIFAGGAAPCANCPGGDPLGGLEKPEAVMGDIWLETEHIGDSTLVTVVYSSPVDIGALQLDLTGVATDESGITRLAVDMALFSSKEGDRQKIGLIDMTGHKPLSSGEQKVLRLGMGSHQNVQVSSAILVGTDARHLAVTIQANRSSVTVPDRYDLAQNCPNPFNPTTFISYSLPAAGQVKLEVLNVLGQHVATLVDDYRAAGVHRAIWEGTDDQGRSVASGVYFYRLRADNFTQTRRMVLLK